MPPLRWTIHMLSFCLTWISLTVAEDSLNPGLDSILSHINIDSTQAALKSLRSTEERARILSSIVRPQYDYKFDNSHPRYNLLWAMYGFWRHGDRYYADTITQKNNYMKTSKFHRDIIDRATDFSQSFDVVQKKHALNGEIAKEIVKHGQWFYQISDEELALYIHKHEEDQVLDDQERVVEALQHIYRDWSLEGTHERAAVVETIKKTIDELFPDREGRKEGPVNVLLPGSGLGRLAHDIASMDNMEVTANELSSYMRLAYHFVESLSIPESRTVHPFVDWWSYQRNRQSLIQEVKFPDVPINKSEVLLVEGDFNRLFVNHTSHYDVVFTFFFMDTAKNMMYYMDTITNVLKPGGIWINIGPLLYHEATVEFSLDDMLAVTEEYGYKFLDVDEDWGPLTLENRKARQKLLYYLANQDGLRVNAYKTQFFAAKLESKTRSRHDGHDEL